MAVTNMNQTKNWEIPILMIFVWGFFVCLFALSSLLDKTLRFTIAAKILTQHNQI